MVEFFQVVLQVIRLLWDLIYLLLPIKATIVREGETGVRFTLGRPGKNLGPGLHCAVFCQTLVHVHTRLCTSPLESIHLMLSDGVPISVTGVLTYEITDLGAYLTHSENTDWLITEFAEASLRYKLAAMTFEDFHTRPEKLDTQVKKDLQGQMDQAGLGVKIQYFRLNDLVVTCPTTRTALAHRAIVGSLQQIPNEMADQPSFGAKVALVAGATATNQVVTALQQARTTARRAPEERTGPAE